MTPTGHEMLINDITQIADRLEVARVSSARVGANSGPPACQVCLATSAFLSQLASLLWLWRWAHIGSARHGAGVAALAPWPDARGLGDIG